MRLSEIVQSAIALEGILVAPIPNSQTKEGEDLNVKYDYVEIEVKAARQLSSSD